MPWLLLPALVFLPFTVVLVWLKTAAFLPNRRSVEPVPVHVARTKALRNFVKLLKIPTVSRVDESLTDWASFDAFIEQLAALYPKTHDELQLERVQGYGLLYRWEGKEPGSASVLMAHYDTVPADDGDWPYPPFEPTVVEGMLWARGTIDDKCCVGGIMEAVETLVSRGYRPLHDVYVAFGCNEETDGSVASAIAERLRSSGVDIAFVLDEGGAIVEPGAFPGVPLPMAVVGIAEKGVLDVTLTAKDPGGHASTPEGVSATTRISRAVTRIAADPFPARFTSPVRQLFDTAGRYASLPFRIVFANLWLFGGLLSKIFLLRGGESAALVHTTATATMLAGAAAPNVLAEEATANINVRILPGETVTSAVARIARVIDDPRVEISVLKGDDPSPVSRTDGEGWERLETAIRQSFPDAIPTPYLMLGASDSRFYARSCDAVFRFSPIAMSNDVRSRLHATGEHVEVDAYMEGIGFYQRLLRLL